MRILIADDNPTDRLLLSTIIGKEGHEVVTAVDGIDALKRFEKVKPDMVLLDALMPGKDGFEVARCIKSSASEKFIPLIFLTSLTEADALARCLDAGGDDFLSKPYNKIILHAKINAFERMRKMHVVLHEQRDHIARNNARLVQEQEAAKDILDRVAHAGCLHADNIKYLLSPLAVFNGDVLFAARNPGGEMYVFLGDFTGHGLTAGIGAMPLAEIFYGMTRKGFHPKEILRESNKKLKSILPVGFFCCAMLVAFNFKKSSVEVWNGGLPNSYIRRTDGDVDVFSSQHLPLGILSPEAFDDRTQLVNMSPGDRLIMCTDGILEARDTHDEMFGTDNLEAVIRESKDPNRLFDTIRDTVYGFMSDSRRDDDLTLAEVAMVQEDAVAVPVPEYGEDNQSSPRDWKLSYELGPESLRLFNPLPLLQHILMEVPELRVQSSAIFTVLVELYNNALEHGVLALDSALKSSATGFAQYYEQKDHALNHLSAGFVRFDFVNSEIDQTGMFHIEVTDSGDGFDFAALTNSNRAANAGFHGRGIGLIRSLCEELRYLGRGNRVAAIFRWSKKNE